MLVNSQGAHALQAHKAKWPAGTPLFLSIQALKVGFHSIGTELETIFYVIIFVLLDGVHPWDKALFEGADYITFRLGCMLPCCFEEQILAKVPHEAQAWVLRMHDLFFPPGTCHYTTEVSCQEFREACIL